MKTKKKKITYFIAILISFFLLINIGWYSWMKNKYTPYANQLDEFVPNRSYVLHKDSFYYNVKFPDYLTFVGNLAVATDDDKYALIIWPSVLGDNKYGVQITDSNQEVYSIMINKEIEDINEINNPMLDEYKEQIEILFIKAKEQWGEI